LIYLNGTLISTSHDKTLKLWDVRSGRCFTTVEGHQRGVYGMAVQETILYSAAGKVLKTWDLRQIGATTLLQGSAVPPVKPRVGNGGEATMGNATGVYGHYLGNQFLYSNSTDPSIRRWDLQRLRCIGLHDGHRDYVRALSGAAERLFSASDDG
jgi:WD40 repeat protein